jgi:hypothetical protein
MAGQPGPVIDARALTPRLNAGLLLVDNVKGRKRSSYWKWKRLAVPVLAALRDVLTPRDSRSSPCGDLSYAGSNSVAGRAVLRPVQPWCHADGELPSHSGRDLLHRGHGGLGVDAASARASIAQDHGLGDQASTAYAQAIELLPMAVWHGLTADDRRLRLVAYSGLARGAAAPSQRGYVGESDRCGRSWSASTS